MTGTRWAMAFCAAAAILASGGTPAAGQTRAIQIKGSDTMVNLGQAWAEAFAKKNPGVNIAVTGGGSGTGFSALINGTCDLAEASRAIEAKEIEIPVSQLTLDQLREIFLGNIDDWRTLGGPKKPIVVLSREFNSGTHIFFKEHVLRRGNAKGPEEFAPAALLMPSSQAIADEVAGNENAIGYYGMGYISPRQKVIAVAKDAKSPYVAPSVETVRSNAYPISRPLYIYSNGKPQGVLKEFVDFIFSPEGQAIVKRIDFVPIK
jgi:phosphate transport system substrate-binding protein